MSSPSFDEMALEPVLEILADHEYVPTASLITFAETTSWSIMNNKVWARDWVNVATTLLMLNHSEPVEDKTELIACLLRRVGFINVDLSVQPLASAYEQVREAYNRASLAENTIPSGMGQSSTIQLDTEQPNTEQPGTPDTEQPGTPDTIRPDTVQSDTIQPDVIQPDAIMSDFIQPSMIQSDMGQFGTN